MGGGRLPIEVYGSELVDAADIDLTSVLVAGVSPVKAQNDIDYDGDGLVDLKVHINRRDRIDPLSLDAEPEDAVVDVELTATRLSDGWAIEATDVVIP